MTCLCSEMGTNLYKFMESLPIVITGISQSTVNVSGVAVEINGTGPITNSLLDVIIDIMM